MSRLTYWIRGAAALALAVGMTACSPDADLVGTNRAPDGLFERYAALGNSITAGWQSGGINDSLQRRSYAFLVAQQMGTRFAYPQFAAFGCPAPVGNFVSGKLIDSLVPAAVRQSCYLRTASSGAEVLNNVAVPYAYANDLTSSGSTIIPGNPLWNFILGGKTMVDKAIDLDPTFASVWVGNNELLFPATYGLLNGPAVGVSSPPLIPSAVWAPMYTKAVDSLKAGARGLQGGILIGVVDVVNIPRFFRIADVVTVPARKAAFDAAAGRATTVVDASCATTTKLASIELLFQIRAGTHPAVISCTNNFPAAPVGDIFMLDAAEVGALSATAAAYNAHIAATAQRIGWAYLDPNPVLAQLRASGAVPAVPDFASKTAPFGAYFSLDGAHPSSLAHRVIANEVIKAINAKYATTVPLVSVP